MSNLPPKVLASEEKAIISNTGKSAEHTSRDTCQTPLPFFSPLRAVTIIILVIVLLVCNTSVLQRSQLGRNGVFNVPNNSDAICAREVEVLVNLCLHKR